MHHYALAGDLVQFDAQVLIEGYALEKLAHGLLLLLGGLDGLARHGVASLANQAKLPDGGVLEQCLGRSAGTIGGYVMAGGRAAPKSANGATREPARGVVGGLPALRQ
jgi:hypothetical protein